MAMASARHLAWTNGRVQEQLWIGIKESISVPILDAKALNSHGWKEDDMGYRIS
jgi:hypothetical protein